jgi:hypothetical protein
MSFGQALRPKEPRNLVITMALCLVLVVVYLIGDYLQPQSPKRGFGLVFGFLAAFLFIFEMMYPVRRPRARPLKTAKRWLQLHLYLGVIALLSVLMHTGFHWPHGGMGWWLLLLSAWTSLTGLLGVWLQKWIPSSLSDGLRVEALYERIPGLIEKLCTEADTLVADASDVLDRFYRTEVRTSLGKLTPSYAYLVDVRSGRERALEPFRRLGQFVDEEEKEKVDDLMSIYTEKLELDAQYSLQGILRRWLVLHVPAAGLLMGLMVIHVFGWLWY